MLDEHQQPTTIPTKSALTKLIRQAIDKNDIRLMRDLELYCSNPLNFFVPRPDQDERDDQQSSFFFDKFRGIAVCRGGNGSGKSLVASAKAARFILDTPPPRPNTPFWVLSRNFDTACGVCWEEKLSKFILPGYIKDISWFSRSKNWAQTVVLHPNKLGNNWILEFKSQDSSRERLQGASIGGFLIDEQVDYSILMELYARCRDYYYPGSMCYVFTPLEKDVELEKIYNTRDDHPEFKFYRMNTECNTTLPAGYLNALLGAELDERKETRRSGAFTSFTGQVFKHFTDKNIVEPFCIPEQWWHLRGLDFGFANATACIWLAKNPITNVYYVYAEYRKKAGTIEEHLEAIMGMAPWRDDIASYGPTWSDYGAGQERLEFSKKGCPTQAAYKDVKAGIACVQAGFRESKLMVFSTCKMLMEEIKSYSWHKTLDKPIKEHDDLLDSLRYALYADMANSMGWDQLRPRPRDRIVPF